MSERLSTSEAAYRKGAIAAKNRKSRDTNPYGMTKIELMNWWFAGYNDYKNGMISIDPESEEWELSEKNRC